MRSSIADKRRKMTSLLDYVGFIEISEIHEASSMSIHLRRLLIMSSHSIILFLAVLHVL